MRYFTILWQRIYCVSGLVNTNQKGGVEGGVGGGVTKLQKWRRVAQKTQTLMWQGFPAGGVGWHILGGVTIYLSVYMAL